MVNCAMGVGIVAVGTVATVGAGAWAEAQQVSRPIYEQRAHSQRSSLPMENT